MNIYLNVTVDGVSKDLSVKHSWLLSRWNGKCNRAIGNKEDARSPNDYLDIIQNKLEDSKNK